MPGIYGSHPEDRYFARMLDKYLDETYGDEVEQEEHDEEESPE
jgi:hypothetical protein